MFHSSGLLSLMSYTKSVMHHACPLTKNVQLLQLFSASTIPQKYHTASTTIHSNPHSRRTLQLIPQRGSHVVRCRDKNGNMIDSKHVTERFKRLGNGVWIKRHKDYEDPDFFKIAKKGVKYVYQTQRHTICEPSLAKNLDKLVTRKFKKHRWTVSDPYAGYDEDVKFHYHPADLPNINRGKKMDARARWWERFHEYLDLNKKSKRRQLRHTYQSNRQKPILKNLYYH